MFFFTGIDICKGWWLMADGAGVAEVFDGADHIGVTMLAMAFVEGGNLKRRYVKELDVKFIMK
ncbi:hypothetical protein NST50_27050 [Paenibacillus sp. FSL E2-0202]